MTAALTPDQAAAYVRELSADVRAVVVLAADGRLLAGPAPLAAPVRDLLAAAGDAPDAAVRTPGGVVLVARTAVAAVVAVAGPLSLLGPTGLDVRTAVEALAPPAPAVPAQAVAPPPSGPAAPPPHPLPRRCKPPPKWSFRLHSAQSDHLRGPRKPAICGLRPVWLYIAVRDGG